MTDAKLRRLHVFPMFALLWAGALACQSPGGVDPLGEWETLLRLPGVRVTAFDMASDGTLFIATPDAIFRALPESPESWSLVTNTDGRFTIELHALSRDRIYALVRFGEVYQWGEQIAWSSVGEIPDSLFLADGGERRAFVRDWWIPNANEIYLAGQAGLLLRYDGQAWGRVRTDGVPALDWMQIDGDASRIVLAGPEIWQREGGVWNQLPGGAATLECAPMALVVRPTDVLIAGYWAANCLMRFESGEWSRLPSQLHEFREHPFGGQLQSDGTVLVWSSLGDLAHVTDATATIRPMPTFFDFGGAALQGEYVYFGGTNQHDGIVGRMRQP